MREGCEVGRQPSRWQGLKEPNEREGHRRLITQGSEGHKKLVKF